MIVSRRAVLAGLVALGGCAPDVRSRGDVLAAGQPAAILLLALAPDRLMGWPRRPEADALALLPPRDLPQLGALTSGGAPASWEALAALGPRMIVDYGDIDPRFRAIAARAERRLDASYHLIDGALDLIPQAFLRAGELVERGERARLLADRSSAVLAGWRGTQSERPAFYYARGNEGLETGFAGSLATEVLEGAGWRNVAVGGRDVGRVSRDQIAVWNPEVIVTLSEAFAVRAIADPIWSRRRSGARRRLLSIPDLPFGWIDRPPSINRLLGCAWLAGGARGAELATDLARLLWGVPEARMRTLTPRWLA